MSLDTSAVSAAPAKWSRAAATGGRADSPNAVDPWVSRTLPESRTFSGLAHNGQVYCAVGMNGAIGRSSDGTTWEVQTPPDSEAYWSWVGILAIGGNFVAVGVSDSVMTSPDCVNWTVRSPDVPPPPFEATGFLLDIAYGEGLYVAVGETYSSPTEARAQILTSPDAVSWTGLDPGIVTGPLGFWTATVGYGDGRFVAAWTAVDDGDFHLLTSENGVNWIERLPPAVEPHESFSDIRWDGAGFVGAGKRIWSSPDGIAWTLRSELGSQSLAQGPQGWSGVGGSLPVASPDGAHWVTEPAASRLPLTAVVAEPTGTGFLAVGLSTIQRTDSIAPIFLDDFESGDTTGWGRAGS